MTRKEFEDNRKDLLNEDWVPFARMPAQIQSLLMSVGYNHLQVLRSSTGVWVGKGDESRLPGAIYRINPNWEGPNDPEKDRCIDNKPYQRNGSGAWVVQDKSNTLWLIHDMHIGAGGCIGFVYGGKVYPFLQIKDVAIDRGSNGISERIGYELIIPDAVRFIKS